MFFTNTIAYFVLVLSPDGKGNSGSKSQFLLNNVPSVVALVITWKAYRRTNGSHLINHH